MKKVENQCYTAYNPGLDSCKYPLCFFVVTFFLYTRGKINFSVLYIPNPMHFNVFPFTLLKEKYIPSPNSLNSGLHQHNDPSKHPSLSLDLFKDLEQKQVTVEQLLIPPISSNIKPLCFLNK